MKRREFLLMTLGMSGPALFSHFLKPHIPFLREELLMSNSDKETSTQHIFSQIIKKAQKKRWAALSIGECMGNIGSLLLGTQYVGGTLEGKGPEFCRVDLTGLDCVTFFENVLCMARILRKGKTSFDDFIEELTFTRYRRGELTDYTSRLHYTSDWIYDNEQKKVVRNITREIGGEEFRLKVSFMSDNPKYYLALREFPEFIETIACFEQEINKRKHWYIPQRKIKKVQEYLQTGDIIALATAKKGLDYAHTGLAYRDERGKLRFLHASLEKKKVCLDTELHKYVQSVETHIGISIARPLEVK